MLATRDDGLQSHLAAADSQAGKRVLELARLDPAVLPPGIRSRFVDRIDGLRVHSLEAGFETSGRPCVLLLHGFPELAYSWRKIMAPLADMPSASMIAACDWLPESELAVYSSEHKRTGFQGGLNWYRNRTIGFETSDLQNFSGRSIDVPSLFIAGTSDWGVYQTPGAFEAMAEVACTRMQDRCLIGGAGHWVQQEQPSRVVELLIRFLSRSPP